MSQIKRLLLLPLTLLVTCLVAGPLSAQSQQMSTTFVNADGKPIGTAILKQTPSGVLIDINVSGLPPGAHALLPPCGRAPFRQSFAEAAQAPQPPAGPCPAARASCLQPPERISR